MPDFDPATMKTSAKGCLPAEIVTGPGTAVEAMANGRAAAKAVDAYLEGKPDVCSMVEQEEPFPELIPVDLLM